MANERGQQPFFERPAPVGPGGVSPELAALASRVVFFREPPYLHRDNPFAVAAAELEERLAFARRGVGFEGIRRVDAMESMFYEEGAIRVKPGRIELFMAAPDHEAMVCVYNRFAVALAGMGMHDEARSITYRVYTGFRRKDLAQKTVDYARDLGNLSRSAYQEWSSKVKGGHFEVGLEEGYHEVRWVLSDQGTPQSSKSVQAPEPKDSPQIPRKIRVLQELSRRGLWPPKQ